jgi:hypothetical protein
VPHAPPRQVYLARAGCDAHEVGHIWEELRRVADTDGDGKVSRLPCGHNLRILIDYERFWGLT